MKVRELMAKLNKLNLDAEIFVSSDEELNTIYSGIEAENYGDETKVVIWGNSGSEVEE